MEKLGIEPLLLIAQIVNFLIILAVLTKLLYKPILGMLEKRKREIEESLRLTEKLRQEEEKLTKRAEKILAEARAEGRAIIEEAKKQAKEAEKTVLSEAHNEARDTIEKGKVEVSRMKDALARDIRREAITLAEAMAKRLLASNLGPREKRSILTKHIKELTAGEE